MIYTLSIFNRKCNCVYFREWNRPKSDPQRVLEDQSLMYGMLFSMKLFCSKMAPHEDQRTQLHCYRTSAYKLHFYESLTGVKMVLLTDPGTPDLHDVLCELYNSVYIDYVVKNPFVLRDYTSPINCELFSDHVQSFLAKYISQKN